MNSENARATRTAGSASQCLHSRMLENLCDAQGNTADTLRCSECGALVVIHTQHAQVS